jgi:alginate O-acetyltransferase complex protein AlgI
MLFNSMEFWAFFAVVAGLYFLLPHRLRWVLLLVASAGFYMRWNALYIVVIMVSGLIDYVCGLVLGDSLAAPHPERRAGQRLRVLAVSLTLNLAILFVFKYWDFFHDSVSVLAALGGLVYRRPDLELLLPVGISFYTFQSMAYTIDVYRGDFPKPERHVGMFALYLLYFPQLVAGPIERAANLLHQLRMPQTFDYARIVSGLQLALWGLFKKTVVADRVGLYVDMTYVEPDQHSGITLLLATYAFAFQIYCDFSGYSDIAIGVSRVLGIELMKNFDRPYFSTSIRDFWRRWHISLSTWLRDYLYVPLGGNRGSELFTYRNLMITMLLGGLWHGASWNFVIWGGLQGLMLSVSRATLDQRTELWNRLGVLAFVRDGIRMVICFHLVCLSWVFFRAATLGDALEILQRIATMSGPLFVDAVTFAHGAVGVAVLLCAEALQSQVGSLRQWLEPQPWPVRWAVWYALGAMIVLMGVQTGSQFIYFQF